METRLRYDNNDGSGDVPSRRGTQLNGNGASDDYDIGAWASPLSQGNPIEWKRHRLNTRINLDRVPSRRGTQLNGNSP